MKLAALLLVALLVAFAIPASTYLFTMCKLDYFLILIPDVTSKQHNNMSTELFAGLGTGLGTGNLVTRWERFWSALLTGRPFADSDNDGIIDKFDNGRR
ncbi:hypothetical protein B566_EDAN008520 [Ephemera danica]|nr:hypothetical protein B566_EDAN008520 [Ephemera danica]